MGNNRNRNRNKKREEDNYIPPFSANQLATPIEELKLRDETLELLKTAGLTTVMEIVKRAETDFYRIPHFNKKNLTDVKFNLNSRKMHLKPQVEPKAVGEGNENADSTSPSNGETATAARPQEARSVRGANPPREQQRPNVERRANGEQRDGTLPRRSAERREGDNGQPGRDGRGGIDRDGRNPRTQTQGANGGQRNSVFSRDGRGEGRIDGRSDNRGRNLQREDRGGTRGEEISEKKTKELREKNRPPKSVAQTVSDIYVKLNKGGKWGFSDRQGKIVVAPIYDEIYSYKEELCCVEINEHAGFIDRHGEMIIEPEYDCAASFSEGFACVFKGDKCGYIDKENNVVVDFVFDAGTAFENGSCRVKRDGKWGELGFTVQEDGSKRQEIRWII